MFFNKENGKWYGIQAIVKAKEQSIHFDNKNQAQKKRSGMTLILGLIGLINEISVKDFIFQFPFLFYLT